jgi:TonB family protein
MSTQPELQTFDAPVLWVEARYRRRTLCARLLSADARRPFTIGGARHADAPVDPRYLPAGLAANDNHALVAPSGAGFVISLSPAMREHAQRSATRVRIPCGEVVFDITAAAPPPAVPRSWLRPGFVGDARITGAVALGVLLLLAVVRAVPSDPHALSLDDVARTLRFSAARVVPPAPTPPELPKIAGGPAAGGGARTRGGGPLGAAGSPKARPADTRRATRGDAVAQDARAVEAAVRASPLLAILDGPHAAPLAAVLDDKPALGDHAEEVLAHVDGTVVALADAFGNLGLHEVGTGRGAGDEGKPMIGGPAFLNVIGPRRVSGRGIGLDPDGPGRLGPRPVRAIDFIPQPPTVLGSLDKEIVRRVVRQHVNEVRYCYEQALVRRPTLAGRVVAMFTIAPNGRVLTSALQSSTLGAPAVDACIVAATKRWEFPQPSRGAGLVTVSYPFQLAPAGG